jgi:hypothetical protein
MNNSNNNLNTTNVLNNNLLDNDEMNNDELDILNNIFDDQISLNDDSDNDLNNDLDNELDNDLNNNRYYNEYINTLLELELSLNNMSSHNYNDISTGNISINSLFNIINSIQTVNNLMADRNKENNKNTIKLTINDKKYFEKIRHNDKIKCNICYGEKKLFTKLNECQHEFCNGCIKKWIKTKTNCPLCRTNIIKE